MSNTPQQPSGSTVTVSLPASSEIYWCPTADTLDSGDLIPNSTGDIDIEPQRQVTRTLLHNGKDYVGIGSLQSNDFTARCYLTDSDTKLQEMKTALKNGTTGKINVFFRDGSGVKGYAYVTRIKTADDPANNDFVKEITFSPYLVDLIDAP